MNVFEALGDPVRRLILELLAAGEQPTGSLVAALQSRMPISQPAVSQHLKVLRGAGLVSVRAVGTRRIYAVDQAGLDIAREWLARLADLPGPGSYSYKSTDLPRRACPAATVPGMTAHRRGQ